MTDDLEQLLRNLHLKKIAEIVDEQMAHAQQAQLSYGDFLARLLRAQYHHRQESALTWRIKHAGLPEHWTLESFPFKRQPGVSAKQIRGFAELDFLAKAENIVFIGPTGVGKTGLASGLLLKAIQNGHRGRFIRAQDLFDELYASLADRSTRKLLNTLIRIDLLVIDELGFGNLKPEQTNVFFKLMEERYRRKATIVTTNLEYTDWHSFLGNKVLVDCGPETVDAAGPVDAQTRPPVLAKPRRRGFAQRPTVNHHLLLKAPNGRTVPAYLAPVPDPACLTAMPKP